MITTNNLFNDILALQSTKRTAKQQRIIESAIQLFAEKGYANTSTAEIAKAAEVSEASIFKHYGTKVNLLLSLILPYMKEIFPAIASETFERVSSNANSTFEGFLRELIKNRIAFIMENREIFQVLVKEILYKEDLKSDLLPYVSGIVKARITGFIDLFKEQGELIDIPTDRIMKLLFTFIGGFIASRFVLLNMESIDEEEVEDAIRFVMDGIRK
jgi:AcrR family transcriptional regulator